MQVIYRITEIPSTNPSPWGKNKKELNKVCLQSFVEAFKDVNPEMYFIADYCGLDTERIVDEIVPFKYHFEHTKLGINETMNFAYELASNYDDYVLLQECDYLYRPGIGKSYLAALNKLDIISPYDHRNFYIDWTMHSPSCELSLIGEQHYRTTERNTMTWATHGSLIKNNLDMLKRHGYLDDEVWFELLVAGHKLWVPILSFATHCVEGMIAPGVEWNSLWNKYQS